VKIPPLPDALIDELVTLLDKAEPMQWAIGEFIVKVWEELGDAYANVFKQRNTTWSAAYAKSRAHAWFVAHLAERTGTDVSTLRDRESMVGFWGEHRRDYEQYTYHQLRAYKAAGDNWRQVMRECELEADKWGKLPSVRDIRNYIRDNGGKPAWENRWKRFIRLAELLAEDEDAPNDVREVAGTVIRSIPREI